MKTITKTGLVTDKMIRESIAKQYDVANKDIIATASSREEAVQYSFTKDEGGKFSTMSTTVLNDDDIFQIVRDILHAEKISFHSLKPEFEHIPGDSYEPLDYGTYKYRGMKFTYMNND